MAKGTTSEVIRAPWDQRTIELLSIYQQGGIFHEYTCGRCSDDPLADSQVLIPSENGWVCPSPTCQYRQDWCHASTLQWTELYANPT